MSTVGVWPVQPDSANPLWNPWATDRKTLELYRRRCRQEAEEMTCAAQAAEILAEKVVQGETLLDAGCGGGYYYWSFHKRGVVVEYYGLRAFGNSNLRKTGRWKRVEWVCRHTYSPPEARCLTVTHFRKLRLTH